MPPQKKRGFALIVTIVLVAFLVLILVGLATFTRVETQVADNSQQLALARQNALLGLNIALGQLQKFAGPDQRVTANADLTPDVSNPHYTGVWNVAAVNEEARANSPLAPASFPSPETPDVWLVSGNETNPLSVNAATDTSAAALFETLVGNHTATQSVRAKKVVITSDQTPATEEAATIGRYAYWVGDEGVKAKFNVADPYTPRPAADGQPAFAPDSTQSAYRLTLAQRFGIEQIATAADVPLSSLGVSPTANNAATTRLHRDLDRVLVYSNTSQALPAFDANTRRARYHDVTTHSFGLATDTANGGLKFDLTWELSKQRNTADPQRLEGPIFTGKCADADNADNSYWPTGAYNDPLSAKNLKLNPRWSVLRDFYQIPDRVASDGSIAMTRKQWAGNDGNNTAVNNPITPVFVQLRIYLGAEETSEGVYARTYFMLLLSNPYNAHLSVPANSLRFGYWDEESSLMLSIRKDSRVFTSLAVMKQFTNGFTCDEPLLFEPGEVKVLTMPHDISDASTPVILREGVRANAAFRNKRDVTPTTIAPPLDGWRLSVSVPNNRGWLEFFMRENASSVTIQNLRFLPYAVPAGAANTFNGAADAPIKIGGFFASLKMPGEPGYADNRSVRFLTDHNIRAQFPGRFRNDELFSFSTYYNTDSDSYTSNLLPTPFWGLSTSDSFGRSTGQTILFDIPRRPVGASTEQPVIISLGQLQHANISNTAQQPAYAIGNSYASLYCQPERSISVARPVNRSGGVTRMSHSWFYDMSYLLNEALWDRYYFSTIPQTTGAFNPASDLLANSRHVIPQNSGTLPVTQATLTADAYAASTHLLVNGAFNVNSTSIEAWKSLFSSLRGLSFNGDSNLNAPFFRSLHQTGRSSNAGDGQSDNSWTGFRDLTSSEINLLAEKMVEQVRLRGPFRSLGDFVNRRLLTAANDPSGLRLRGALQAAIDAAGINDAFDSTGTPGKGNDTSSAYTDSSFVSTDPALQWMIPANAVGNRATGAPGWLTQADVLQALGPVLTARSDTFVIRAYGEAVNPVTLETSGRAWCEAVVQRTVDYIDSSAATGNQPADAFATLQPDNQDFGRRFKIVSFRWLAPNDI